MKIYFPRWFWPNNLGDSLAFCCVPKFIKILNPVEPIEVITFGGLIPLLQNSKNVDQVRLPYQHEISTYDYYLRYSRSERNNLNSEMVVIYPENHPKLFNTIRDNFSDFINHDSLNFITLNYLLQLNAEQKGFKIFDFYSFDSREKIQKNKSSKLRIGIAPMEKTNGKSNPHPGCDGIGFRFNGAKGLNSWKLLVKKLKSNLDLEIVEFSPSYLNIGDTHVGIKNSLFDLYYESCQLDYAITTDGGYHHLFNLNKTPLTLFTGTKVTKPEFMQLGNAYVPDIHLDCRKRCASFYSEVFSVDDQSKTCKLECENLNESLLADKCISDIYKRCYEKK